MFEFLKPPTFPEPANIYLPLPSFPGANPKQEIADAIASLNDAAKAFSASKSFTKEYLALIGEAEAHAANSQWSEAHQTIWETTFLINRALESKVASKFRKWMAVYYGGWLLFLALIGWWLRDLEAPDDPVQYFGATYWRYVLMGALGGLTIAIWGLTLHSANLDFDRAFAVWYWLKPLLGAVMGLIAVIAAQAGLFAIQGQSSLRSNMALYILAFLAGFSERFFIRVIDRVMTALFTSESASSSSSQRAGPKASASGTPS